ncbi:MAG: hypothetical protein JJU11_00720 [Candidatus Sumerlaeia bacterium]|nr:hypothetical protein [Candidatus Sumerlaeia bacterium]
MAEFIAAKFSEEEMPVIFDPGDLRGKVKPQDFVVVPRGEGEDVAFVACMEYKSSKQLSLRRNPYPRVIRRANEDEVSSWWTRKATERRAMVICKDKARELKLDIKISHVRIDEQDRKAIFHFTSDQRVDFRALVKELSALIKLRIELWQIRVRDEARMIDGYGVCGQKTCCSTWLKDFSNIAIRMAKDQDINLPPSKLSGQCGRLLCCLSYEVDQYREMSREALPKGSTVTFEDAEWVIMDRNLIAGTYHLTNRSGLHKTVKAAELAEGEAKVPEQMQRMGRKVFKAKVPEDLEAHLPSKEKESVATSPAVEEAPEAPPTEKPNKGRPKKKKRRKGHVHRTGEGDAPREKVAEEGKSSPAPEGDRSPTQAPGRGRKRPRNTARSGDGPPKAPQQDASPSNQKKTEGAGDGKPQPRPGRRRKKNKRQ